MWITNKDGEQVEVTVASSSGWTIRNDGVVEYFRNGEEWTDLMDGAIDPRSRLAD